MDWTKDFKEDIKNYKKIGEPLNDALIRFKIGNLSNKKRFRKRKRNNHRTINLKDSRRVKIDRGYI